MANSKEFLSYLKTGRCPSVVTVRLGSSILSSIKQTLYHIHDSRQNIMALSHLFSIPSHLHTASSPFISAPNRNRVCILAKSCPDNQSFGSKDSNSSPETTNETQGDQQSMSRKHWMMTCVCLSPALVTDAYTFVSVQNAAGLDKKPEVCRDCQSIGYMCGATGKWKALNRKGSKDVYELLNVLTVTVEANLCIRSDTGLSNNKERPGAHEPLDTMYNGRLLLNSRAAQRQ